MQYTTLEGNILTILKRDKRPLSSREIADAVYGENKPPNMLRCITVTIRNLQKKGVGIVDDGTIGGHGKRFKLS